MSIIATVELEVKDLDAAARAARRLGLELRKGQRTFRQHISHGAGDQCDHAIGVIGSTSAYEIGMIKKEGGVYQLKFDHYQRGKGLMEKVASGDRLDNIGKFQQAYATEVVIGEFKRAGHRYRESTDASGNIKLEAFVSA